MNNQKPRIIKSVSYFPSNATVWCARESGEHECCDVDWDGMHNTADTPEEAAEFVITDFEYNNLSFEGQQAEWLAGRLAGIYNQAAGWKDVEKALAARKEAN